MQENLELTAKKFHVLLKNKLWFRRLKMDISLYMMLMPGLILILIFNIVPFYGIIVAFKDYNIFRGINDSPWVGFQWFEMLFQSPDFFRILRNTLTINILSLIFGFPAPIILALLLNELRSKKLLRFTQTIVYIPHFFSWVVVGGMVIQFLSPSTGLVRYIFEWFGAEPQMLLLNPNWFYTILISSGIWKEIGWGTILYLAAIVAIDPQLYEAAKIDGASRIRRIWHISLPGLQFVIVLNLVLTMGGMIDVGFDRIFILATDAVLSVSEVFSTFNYRVGLLQERYSFSVALGLFESTIGFVLVYAANAIAKRIRGEGIF